MSTSSTPDGAGPAGPGAVPSLKTLATASALAVAIATLVLVVAVLPAEYAVDPLGTGRALGLTALARSTAPVPPPVGDTLAPVPHGTFALYPGAYKIDSREFVLGPYEYVEYKYQLAKDATMLFSWTADGDVVHDFHGEPDAAPANAEQSFDKQPRRRADGTFAAPFSGIHGWFWENPGGETIRVRLTTAGFYTAAHEFSFDGTRRPRAVRALDTIPFTEDHRRDE